MESPMTRSGAGVVLALALLAPPALAQESAQSANRASGWRGDIAVIREQFLQRDRSYAADERAAALAVLDRLEANVATLSDQAIVAGFAQVAAASRNAHTRAYLLRNRGWWRRYPIRIWPFADGWRVVATQPGYEALLGVRLTRIGGRAIEDAASAVRPLFAGNDAWARYMATYSLTSPDALIGMRVIDSDTIAFEGEGTHGPVSVPVAPMPLVRRDGPEESWWYLSPRNPGWRHVLEGRASATFLAEPTRNYLMRRCAGGTLYVQFFRAQDGQGERVRDFGNRVLAEIAASRPRRLVIDVRFNTGGNLQLAQPFFTALAQSPITQQRRRFFMISGINTFSAGISPMAHMRQDAEVTIVGEGPGDELDYWSEGGNVPLPYSGILMHFADRMHTYSRVSYDLAPELRDLNFEVDSVEPDVHTRLRWADYIAGRDPSLEAIVRRPRCGAPLEPASGQ
jgi:hypothetical protein